MKRKSRSAALGVALLALLASALSGVGAAAAPVAGVDVTYTTSEDFAKGTLVNLNSEDVPNALSLNKTTSTFPFIWVALSDRGTIAKIDTSTGDILGEYSTTSDGDSSANPSRTTVGLDGSAWAGNRNQSSVVHVGLEEANQCVDRNGNGAIDTSSGYGNILPWPGGTSGASAPVSDAADECILHYVDTYGGDARHVSVTKDNEIWVGNYSGFPHRFQRIDGDTGAIIPDTAIDTACGGYGGLVDSAGVLWSTTSSSELLRFDTTAPVSVGGEGQPPENPKCLPIQNYGIAIDANGFLWINEFGSTVHKVAPDGTVVGSFPNGSSTGSQGLAVDAKGDVWISSSLSCSSDCGIGHLRNDGSLVGVVPTPTGAGSTGIAVDAQGKIWAANINSSTATRIDPSAGALAADGVTPIGAVDLTVDLPATTADPDNGIVSAPRANPYNYSDMTGAVLLGSTARQGTWTVVQDGGSADFEWHTLSFNNEPEGVIPPGASIALGMEARAADSEAGLGAESFQAVGNCVVTSGLTGRFLEVRITLRPNEGGDTPVLSDVTLRGGPGVKKGECVKPAEQGTTSTPPKKPNGYAIITGDGGVHARGDIVFVGTASAITAPSGRTLNAPIVGAALTPSGKGYYLVGEDGGVFTLGDAVFAGSTGGMKLNQPIVGIAADPDGTGYWLVARDGGVFSFGAAFAGSTGGMALNQPIVGMAADPDGTGYWLVARDGGVFSFAAAFSGSTGGIRLNQPIVGMAADPDGTGYWLAASDGGVFAFDAPFSGSLGALQLNAPVLSITADPDGQGYWLGARDGGVFAFDADFFGSIAGTQQNAPVIGVIAP